MGTQPPLRCTGILPDTVHLMASDSEGQERKQEAISQVCGHTPTILALEKKRQEDHREFKAVWVTKHVPVRAPLQDLPPNKKQRSWGTAVRS